MSLVTVNGIRLHYTVSGPAEGETVVLVMGTGAGGRAWHLHQVPALVDTGYRVVTYDNRGIPPTDVCADGFTAQDLVGDLTGLIEHLGLADCKLVGTSMGAYVVQELALQRPGLIRQAVLIATRARMGALGTALTRAEIELMDAGVRLPARYDAVTRAMQNLSPRTLADDGRASDWLDILELTAADGPGLRAQLAASRIPDRRDAYRNITVPCHVIAFADDQVTPPHLGREVADAIPGATYEVVPDCGHYGYLEDPGTVNKSIVEFFRTVHRAPPAPRTIHHDAGGRGR
ncbi:alpha/beta fold hydrolase [Streptomyces sp. NPDC050388]|uniref:alpha/beta fold hydrolase n=1 Tax=Streptomyces sp. NPDC050388 TaxID=3155781 RepID=UPI0034189FE4